MNSRQKPLPSPPLSSSPLRTPLHLQNGTTSSTASPSTTPKPAASRRVLGSVPSKRPPAIVRTGNLSPSASTVSLSSQVSGDNGDPASSTGATSPSMACPICSEEMMTLLQLNRHLDDMHREVEEMEKDDVKSWFLRRVQKAKQFQPVAVLNQKLKGLDVFESNAVVSPPPVSTPAGAGAGAAPTPQVIDPDMVVTRAHWQRATSNDYCLEPSCRKPLGAINGSINCRCCGKLFCEEHTMYQMKLSRSAQHEPVRGLWCRVCETCYKSREGYNDHHGVSRDHSAFFIRTRKASVDRAYLETSRLEKRLTKLTQLLANPPPPESTSFLRSVSSMRNQRRQLEQTIVPWEDDASVTSCPYCKQTFSQLSLRKHHCRVCGKIVCGDPRTQCSSEMGLSVATGSPLSEKTVEQISLDVRMCKECKCTIFSQRDFVADLARERPDVRAYQTLVQFEQGIKTMMPRFEKMLAMLQSSQSTLTHQQLTEATRTRKKLTDSFTQYDIAAKRILNLPTNSPTQKHLQKAIHQYATQFLHQNMLPLKSLPRILKSNTKRHASHLSITSNTSSFTTNDETASNAGSMASSAYEIEEKNLKEQSMVLQEQKYLVEQQLRAAQKRRKFDEIGALNQSVLELELEISRVNGLIEKLEAEGPPL